MGGFGEGGVKTRRKRRASHVTRDKLRLGFCYVGRGKIRFVLGLGKEQQEMLIVNYICRIKYSNIEY